MESLSDVINDSEDWSGVISSTPVTELFTASAQENGCLGFLFTLMQLRQPKNVFEVTQVHGCAKKH